MAKKARDERFSTPPAMGESDYMPELKADDPDFMEKFAAANGIKFVDTTRDKAAR